MVIMLEIGKPAVLQPKSVPCFYKVLVGYGWYSETERVLVCYERISHPERA